MRIGLPAWIRSTAAIGDHIVIVAVKAATEQGEVLYQRPEKVRETCRWEDRKRKALAVNDSY
jgi:hypothetical protein